MGSEYIITSDGSFVSDDQLIHALARGNKGWVKPNHKYINLKEKNGRYVYTYETDTGTRAVARTASQQAVKENAEQDEFFERLNSVKSAIYHSSYDKYRAYQKSTDKNTIDKIKDALGFDERDMYKETARNYNKAVRILEDSKNKAREENLAQDVDASRKAAQEAAKKNGNGKAGILGGLWKMLKGITGIGWNLFKIGGKLFGVVDRLAGKILGVNKIFGALGKGITSIYHLSCGSFKSNCLCILFL